MKSFQERLLNIQGKIKSIALSGSLAAFQQRLGGLRERGRLAGTIKRRKPVAPYSAIPKFLQAIKSLGANGITDEYEKRKLGIFNQLNFFQLVTGLLIPVASLLDHDRLSAGHWLMASAPAFVSGLVLGLNAARRYDAGLLAYFILYPVVTSIVYLSGVDLGVELFFILYVILSVFFLQQISRMLFSVSLSLISYFILAVVWKGYRHQQETADMVFYFTNQVAAIVFIVYGLFLIKRENSGYQAGILAKNNDLNRKNREIEAQKQEIDQKATLLKKQTAALTELDSLKNKLFSVIAHDLKSPIYALLNLFKYLKQHDVPADQIKELIPDVVSDLGYTTDLMDNLLQWARCQMQSDMVHLQELDITHMINGVVQLLQLQAQAKQIRIKQETEISLYVRADKDMVALVLRNLLSNAIKFTPEKGLVRIGAQAGQSFVEVFVKDSGVGISEEAMQKIKRNDYYTTKGTASESGTGLGLMLCREFLAKNSGQLHIESSPGKGSTFSFALPLYKTTR